MKRARDPDTLRRAVEDRDLTHRELAKLADCSYGTVGFVLSGRPLRPELARRFARILRRPVDALFADVVSTDEQHNGQQGAVA